MIVERRWTIVYWTLMSAFLLTAALAVLRVQAGFLTSHLADLTVPALLYVVSRGRAPGMRRSFRPMRWIGHTPERAAAFFFLASTATEISQVVWPHGLFAGRFDAWDVVAYAAGLLACYALDRHGRA